MASLLFVTIVMCLLVTNGKCGTLDNVATNYDTSATEDGANFVVTDDNQHYTISPSAPTINIRSERDQTVESAMTPTTPRKLKSLPAFVAKPSILQAYPSRLGEENVEQSGGNPLGDKQERLSGNYWRGGKGGCQQYLLQVRKELHCTATPHFEQLVSFDARLRDQDSNAKAQRERLESIERTMKEFKSSIDAMGRRFAPLFDVQKDSQTSESSRSNDENENRNPSTEAMVILTTMTQQLRDRLHEMESRFDQSQRERAILAEKNRELSQQLEQRILQVESLEEENRVIKENQTKTRSELLESKINIKKLTSIKKKMMNKIIQLRNCRLCTTNNRSRFKQCQKEAKKHLGARRQCTQRLQNITVTLSMLTTEITRLKGQLQQVQKNSGGIQPGGGAIEVQHLCDNKEKAENKSSNAVNEKQKQCGRLLSVGNPILISEMDRPGKKCGVWMRDTLLQSHDVDHNTEKIWSLNIPGRQACASSFNQKRLTSIKKRREPILTLFQYANESAFCLHMEEKRIQLPKHKQMESTGAVIYNGSLFYQRRNSRRIIKFDISTRKILAEIPLKNAGFHGMFAYQWGGYSDVDLAVDEFGLWVIYSSTDRGGNIIVAQLNPDNLETIRIVHTNKKKSEVANSFIICGVLYTVSSYNRMNSTINYAYNLLTNQAITVNIPFKNAYRYNTMIDYNPSDQQLYSWDNGRRVVYPVIIGNWDQDSGQQSEKLPVTTSPVQPTATSSESQTLSTT